MDNSGRRKSELGTTERRRKKAERGSLEGENEEKLKKQRTVGPADKIRKQ